MPRVSVVIPVYNACETLVRALESVAAQTFRDFEVIVVDDASPDGSGALARDWAADRGLDFHLITQQENVGAAAARNAGIEAARGEFIAFLDSDDEWLPPKLDVQMKLFDDAPDVVLAGCDAEWLRDGVVVSRVADGPVATGKDAWKALLRTCYIATPCAVAHTDALRAEKGFRQDMVVGEDQDLWFRLAYRGAVAFAPDMLVRVHTRPDSLMKRARFKVATQYLPMIERHLEARADLLSASERKDILGKKYADVGRNFYARKGSRLLGFRLLLKVIFMGYRPGTHLLYLVRHLPPVAAIVSFIRGARS